MVTRRTTPTVPRGPATVGDADLPERAVRQAFKTFETGDVADVHTFCHADYRNYEAPEIGGPEGFQMIVAIMRGAFSNLSFEEQRMICHGDTVALWTVMRGQHTGEFDGLRPTGQVIEQRQIHWIRVQDGKLVEHHAVRDDLRLLVQLGIIPISGCLAAGDIVDVPSCNVFDAVVQGAQLRLSA
ncbi:MAG: ester cyclase [Pseudonocardiales bacterium]|nr:ester cyclase [Pseudonocardiales bacterium]